MIDKPAFADEWKRLCKRFNRQLDQDEARDYFDYLSPQIDTDAFVSAARKLWASREFFPRPDDFLEAANGTTEAEAAEQWELCRRIMAGERGILEQMTPAGRKTVALLGGQQALRQTPVGEVHFRRRDFLGMYATSIEVARREQPARLQPWTEEGARKLKEAVPHLRLLEGGS